MSWSAWLLAGLGTWLLLAIWLSYAFSCAMRSGDDAHSPAIESPETSDMAQASIPRESSRPENHPSGGQAVARECRRSIPASGA